MVADGGLGQTEVMLQVDNADGLCGQGEQVKDLDAMWVTKGSCDDRQPLLQAGAERLGCHLH